MREDLILMVGENPLLLLLRIKHGTLELAGTQLCHVITYADLNRAVASLAAEGRIDLTADAVPFLNKVGGSFLRTDDDIAGKVRAYEVPADIDMQGVQFTACEKCSASYGMRFGHIHSALGQGTNVVSFQQAVDYLFTRCQNGLRAEVGIALLQQVLKADLPIVTPLPDKEARLNRIKSALKDLFGVDDSDVEIEIVQGPDSNEG